MLKNYKAKTCFTYKDALAANTGSKNNKTIIVNLA